MIGDTKSPKKAVKRIVFKYLEPCFGFMMSKSYKNRKLKQPEINTDPWLVRRKWKVCSNPPLAQTDTTKKPAKFKIPKILTLHFTQKNVQTWKKSLEPPQNLQKIPEKSLDPSKNSQKIPRPPKKPKTERVNSYCSLRRSRTYPAVKWSVQKWNGDSAQVPQMKRAQKNENNNTKKIYENTMEKKIG